MAAGNAVIGALRVVLGADTADLDKGLKDSGANVAKFGQDIAVAGAAIAAAIAAAYAAVAFNVNSTLKSMDEIGKQSQKIGIPVEQLSALKLAADLSDVSMESLGKGIGKLSQAMTTAAGQPTSEAANAFRALGVSVKDSNGQLRPTIDVTKDVATRFADLKDGAGKTAVSMAIFGKAGADLIPLLNAGGSGLEQMMNQAKALGITFDTETSKAAEKFRDTLTTVSAAKDGLIVKLTAALLPALQLFADRMLAAASNTDKQNSKLAFLTQAFDVLARGMLVVADNFKLILQLGAVFVAAQLTATVINLGVAFVGLARAIQATGIVMAAVEAIRKISLVGWLTMAGGIAVLTGNFDTLVSKLKEIGGAVASALPGEGGALQKALQGLGIDLSALNADLSKMKDGSDGAGKALKDFNFNALAGKNAVDQFLDSQTKALAGHQAEIATFGLMAGEQEKLKLEYQALAIATNNNTVLSEAQRAKLEELKAKTADYALTLAGLQLQQSNLTPVQAYQLELQKIQTLYDAGKISAETYQAATQKAAETAGATWAQASASIATSFENMGNSISQMSDSWTRVAKIGQAIGAVIGFVNAYVAASDAFAKTPFPANIAVAAGVLAKGLAMVAAIKGAAIPKLAMGGAFRVPGGAGGGDKVPFNAMLEPGELVQVSSNHADGFQAGGSGTKVIELRSNGRRIFTIDQVGQLMEEINDAIAFGYKLKVT